MEQIPGAHATAAATASSSPGFFRRAWSRWWVRLPSVLTGVYVLIALALTVFQDKLIFPGRGPTEFRPHVKHEEWFLKTSDGETIHAWFLHADPASGQQTPDGRFPTMVFHHGNGENIASQLHVADLYRSLGLNVVHYDFRGYGKSSGNPSEAGLRIDAEAVMQKVLAQPSVDKDRLVVRGFSLGGGLAVPQGVDHNVRAIIAEQTYCNLQNHVQDRFIWLPVGLLLKYEFDNRGPLSRYKGAVLLMHGRNDQVIPVVQTERLAKVCPQAEVHYDEGDHFSIRRGSVAAYKVVVAAFLKKAGVIQ